MLNNIFDHNFLHTRHQREHYDNISKLKILQFIETAILDNITDLKCTLRACKIINLCAHCTKISTNLIIAAPNAQIITALPMFLTKPHDHEQHIIYYENTIQHIPHADIVIGIGFLHFINHLSQFLRHICSITKSCGLFMGNVFGPTTLKELRQTFLIVENNLYQRTSPRIIPMIDAKNGTLLLQNAGFKRVVVHTETVTLTFNNWHQFIDFLRTTGSNPMHNRNMRWLGKEFFQTCQDYYVKHFSTESGDIYCTIEIIYLTGFN